MNLFLSEKTCIHCKEHEKKSLDLCELCLLKVKNIRGRKTIGDYSCSFPYLYNGELKRIIYQYKFRRKIYYKTFLAKSLLEDVKRISPDIIVPIPLAKRKLSFRGFHQVGEICEILSEETKVPTQFLLEKTRHTKDQHLITLEERKTNLKGVFSLVEDISGKEILLVDDITTTGMTFLEAAKELEKGNPKSIEFLAVAGRGPSEFTLDRA